MSDRVALLDGINPSASQYFAEQGLEVIEFSKAVTIDEFEAVVRDVELLGVRSGPKVPGEVIEAGRDLQAIGCFCVGTGHVDKEVANKNGVAIFNAVHENTRSVAEHVIASAFGLLRRMPEHSREMHDGKWTKTDEQSYEIRGKKLGIIGYGSIGSQVSVLAEGFGMDVIYYDPAPKMPPHGRAKLVSSMEEVLADSDIVTLHVPGIPTTQKMINEQTLALMKPGSYLINTARGEVVDYEAVAEAIESGRLAGIAADVFEDEPAKRGDSFNHVLRGVGRAILTPHIAGSTVEAQREIGSSVAIKLLGYLSSGNSIGSVNLPELALGDVPTGVRRLLHIHNNVPGVMANVTTVLAESGLNIVGSNQRANEKVAYAAFDIEGEISDDTVQAIRELPETYRLRAL